MNDDGVSFISASHPRYPWYKRLWWRIFPTNLSLESLEEVEIEVLGCEKHEWIGECPYCEIERLREGLERLLHSDDLEIAGYERVRKLLEKKAP